MSEYKLEILFKIKSQKCQNFRELILKPILIFYWHIIKGIFFILLIIALLSLTSSSSAVWTVGLAFIWLYMILNPFLWSSAPHKRLYTNLYIIPLSIADIFVIFSGFFRFRPLSTWNQIGTSWNTFGTTFTDFLIVFLTSYLAEN